MADGSITRAKTKNQRSEDWIGYKQGRLEIVAFDGLKVFSGGGRAAYFTFRCECGTQFSAQKSNVINNVTVDCGCSRARDMTAPEGYTKHPYAKIWNGMHDRCNNPKNKSFPDYGRRGIVVCERWKTGDGKRTGFECFVDDMGSRPLGFTIERRDYNGNYEPGNCEWISKSAQGKNCRGVRIIEIDGVSKTVPDWSAHFGVNYFTAHRRLKRGVAPKDAFSPPPVK